MDLEQKIQELEKEILLLKERNRRVEADKAWETSPVRRVAVTSLTYLVIVIYMYSVKIPSPWLNAIIPSVAYLISTITMPFIKKWWLQRKSNKR